MGEELYEWQKKALDAWIGNGCQGVVQATTGAGKTRLAVAAIRHAQALHPEVCVAVVVPTKALVRQWRRNLQNELGLLPNEIAEEHSGAGDADRYRGQRFVVFVINSAREGFDRIQARWRVRYLGEPILLIVDECHHSGSRHNARLFDVDVDFTLGISATPERTDNRHETHIYPALGDVVYAYSLQDALNDAVVAETRAVNLYVRFDETEDRKWGELEEKINRLERVVHENHGTVSRAKLEKLARSDPTAQRVCELLGEQESLIDRCRSRTECVKEILDWVEASDKRVLVFNERIESAIGIWDELRRRGVPVAVDHSKLDPKERDAVETFRDGNARVLVAVRSLDEGIDVPDADVAVIATGGRTRRQRIQRIGRVARRADGKDGALVVTILVASSPDVLVGIRDEELFGPDKVTHHRWPQTRVLDALAAEASTLDPYALRFRAHPWLLSQLGVSDESLPIPQELYAAASALRDAITAVERRKTSAYKQAVLDAVEVITRCGGSGATGYAVEDGLPKKLPSLAAYPKEAYRVEAELAGAIRLLAGAEIERRGKWISDEARRKTARRLTKSLQRIREANKTLRDVCVKEEQLERDRREHEIRKKLHAIVDAAEALAAREDADAGSQMAAFWTRWLKSDRLSDKVELWGMRERLCAAELAVRAQIASRAERLGGALDPESCRALGAERAAWVRLDRDKTRKGLATGEVRKLRDRLRRATRDTLLAIIEEAEARVDETEPCDPCLTPEQLVERWQLVGGRFDDDMLGMEERFQGTMGKLLDNPPDLVRPLLS